MTPATNSVASISVVLCTHNPDLRLIRKALSSIAAQDLPRERFETILVDNASNPTLELAQLLEDDSLAVTLVQEPRPGLTFARLAGINAASGPLFVFVDDDNALAPDYLRQAQRIADENAHIGAFGGISDGTFDGPVARWKQPLLAYLGVRDYGSAPITSTNSRWGEWDPIGAGMVVRRDVAERFVEMVAEQDLATGLGRQGKSLMSGEDTLIARCANRLNYACSYQPSLRLQHHIGDQRFDTAYLKRLLEGHGRSFVRLERTLGQPVAPVRGLARAWMLCSRLVYRSITRRRAGLIEWHWDLGYVRESREEP